MIKKLERTMKSATSELGDKINEIIDYLQAKEEASKGECKEFWEVPYRSDHLFRGDHHNLPSGNCQKCGKSWFEYNKQAEEFLKTNKEYIEQSKEVDPPEHEESDGQFYGIHQSAGSWYREFENGIGRPLEIRDLKDLFVSKEKIKRHIEAGMEDDRPEITQWLRSKDYTKGYNQSRKDLLESLGLGD